ncbi:flagellar basal body-associated protein FliL [Microbulbifer thermotolerans]|uniref:Flagellar protein FliL n=1 Tax=Microbulbifer thermotolerans TaxID=252514 RepID=A0AB35HZ44_MICTH|nr:flagellar basal body-associated protein FliL [Microbulbifer thermotolerans]MCX2780118.1 flagellar basal body-associated protein FliL [Microbulbifer thermotolerans]MCX2802144.1 flagellar basal body-associated protein FliL [Microbulbifer thermotolerans]MCX2805542.1 flagellar basal body-associated protein FliL [Microbulbifer thermotolerans]MCX2831931.1 flagellar basal body-associated protein FliL [Microbulbifer thermotolerans]MCX2842504.1 flagellar basal body-associated protein FliL [Microbulb
MAETSGKSRGLVWLAIIAAVLLTAVVAINVALLMKIESGNQSTAAAPANKAKPKRAADPIFVKIDPFTVNLQDDLYGRLLYVGLSLQVSDEETQEFLLKHMPQVRSRLLILHSAQSPAKLATAEGKRELAAAILATLAEPMTDPQPELHIDDVLFTEFIVQ